MSSESRPEGEAGSGNGQEEKAPRETGDGDRADAPEEASHASAAPAASEDASAPESGTERAAGPAAQPAPQQAYADRCYRSPGALAGGVLLLLLAVWLGTDALVNGDARTRLSAGSGLLFAVPLVVAFTLRPAVYAGQQRMRVRNPFRTITVPWGTVEALRAGYSSEVVADGAKYQLWSIPVSLRARKRAARQTERAERAAADGHTAGALARPTGLFGLGGVPGADGGGEKRAASDQAIDELRTLAADHGESPEAQGEVTVRWAYEIAAPALAGAVALAVLYATS
ncbi:PH domain-containing protein [Streptomyces sp. WMMB 322]|uniref:PH domain-containing protein n=1 Tax=Streptomyces sp. WMMB 322 TaxID=1286821 RepID=UPI00099EDA14